MFNSFDPWAKILPEPTKVWMQIQHHFFEFLNPLEIVSSKLCSVFTGVFRDIIRNKNLTVWERIVLHSIWGNFKNLNFVTIPQKIDRNRPNRGGVFLCGSLVDIRSMDPHNLNVLKLHVFLEEFNLQEIIIL